ncbi:MAG: cobalamin-independent methionine synthase II family protein [Solirubrobacteraceae bacterium]
MSSTATQKLTSTTAARRPARAEHIGSLLRPEKVKQLVEATYEPGHSALLAEERAKDLTALHDAEDEAIREAVRRQLEIGLDVVSDGEFRRFMFTGSFYDAVDGLDAGTGLVPFTSEDGEVEYFTGLPVVRGELHTIDNPGAHEAAFLKGLTDAPFKVTFPAASIFWFPLAFVPGVTDKVYATQAEMVEHMIEIERGQVAAAIAAGAEYIQFDWPVYPALGDPAAVAMLREHGVDPDWFLERLIEADRKVIADIPDGVRTALHLCRGNHKSKWIYNGPMDSYAERMFNDLPYDVFLMEWEDTEREGDYSALRHVPDGPIVVMGVMSSKKPRVETEDELVRSIEDASRFLDVDRLALSPQCGFASTYHGNEVTEDIQWRKLETLVAAAERIWPHS